VNQAREALTGIRRRPSGGLHLTRPGWLCISVWESFRRDCGSHLLTEFAMSVCLDVTQGLAVGRWGVLLLQGVLSGMLGIRLS
jgi:hypothetical protein